MASCLAYRHYYICFYSNVISNEDIEISNELTVNSLAIAIITALQD
ncbi:MAG: hypothetical protein RMZ41_025230 [Nostoc sp. DedVER02]|nr:hypothetical protein [Nostoc sp. DedVER01b]